MNKISFKQGLTLVELLIAMSLMLILLAALVPFLSKSIGFTYGVANQVYLEQSAQSALMMMADELSKGQVDTLYIDSKNHWISVHTANHTVSFSKNFAGALCRDFYDGAGQQPITDEKAIFVNQLEFLQDSEDPHLVIVNLSLSHKKFNVTVNKSLTVYLAGQGSL